MLARDHPLDDPWLSVSSQKWKILVQAKAAAKLKPQS